jgi:hypothetical protein
MNTFLLSVFILAAVFGFVCFFYVGRVQSVMARICHEDRHTLFLMAKKIADSSDYVKALKFAGVVSWIVAAVSGIALIAR